MSTSQPTQPAVDHLGDSDRQWATPKTEGGRSYWSTLLLKEAKQLAPIVISLVACGFVLHLMSNFGSQHHRAMLHRVSLMMIPFLFAIGAGPLLVSQEKEQRTLGWIGALPINPRSIVLSKLIVCIVGLMLSWIISIGLTCLMGPSLKLFNHTVLSNSIAYTFVVMTLGFTLAWIFSTAISSLIALVVASFVMAFVSQATSMMFASQKYDFLFDSTLWLTSLLFAMAAVFFGQRAFLGKSPTESAFSLKRWGRGRSRSLSKQSRPIFWTLKPSSSLIWQISRQNNLLWSGLLLIVLLSGGLFLFYKLTTPSHHLRDAAANQELIMVLLLPISLALSWLGVSVFGSDAYRERINFLAQRGLAPGLVWWTRMILPLGIVVVLVLLVLIGAQFTFGRPPEMKQLLVSCLMVFAFSQWFSQWTQSSMIRFCLAPAVAVVSYVYQDFVTESLHAPLWILIPSICVAMLATRLMLSPWMDGRMDWRYWTSHVALLLLALTIPLLPFLYTWATYPDMSSDLKRSLAAEVQQYQQSPRPETVGLKSNNLAPRPIGETEGDSNIVSSISDRLDAMQRELSSTRAPVGIPGNKIEVRTADLLSLRMDTVLNSKEPDSRTEVDTERYRSVIVLLDNLVRHLRLSERLQEQDYADVIERWLVSELGRPGRREIFSDQQYASMVAGLADQDTRHQARRRAIVMAWDESKTKADHQFKNVRKKDARLTAPQWLVTRRNAALAASGLLEQLESSVPRPLSYLGELDSIGLGSLPSAGLLWHRPWETQAKKLAESLKLNRQTNGDNDE